MDKKEEKKVELTQEEEELKVTIAQKERMERDHDAIKEYYKGLLKEWADDLAARPLEEKKSPEGREATKQCQQVADTLKGFFKLCTKRRIPYDIRRNLLKIRDQMEEGDYREAYRTYLLITVGNAAWPIGVAATGIYERSSRERITQSSVGHAMLNDTVRIYLTMIKRLMNYKESKSPGVVPSGCILPAKCSVCSQTLLQSIRAS
ncbi:uncharacterized protein [Blastocystis hominis]|uniref:Pre-mRNA-splicing factor 18 n=1 Tax=Blastocystis hominis TaxID=12968 RepID=D8LXE9_BLAHO|nr:uncharacterized protein [Blastocystis hominis]CBK20944.2 unnamed protein product [Blastocystis hominis]|eukprot:XP_012894992.1 uncharacterized protein [Blastocystis hominis]